MVWGKLEQLERELTSRVWQNSNLKNPLLNGGLKARSFCSVFSASIQSDNQAYISIENLYAAYLRTPMVFPYCFIKAWSMNTSTHQTAGCFSCCNHWFQPSTQSFWLSSSASHMTASLPTPALTTLIAMYTLTKKLN